MNIEKHLILIKDEDKTDKIQSLRFEADRWQVIYHGNPTIYKYAFSNVKWYRNPKVMDGRTVIIRDKGIQIMGIERIIDFGEMTRIIFTKGPSKIFKVSTLTLEANILSKKEEGNTFEYLKRLAHQVSLQADGEAGFLGRQYDKIKYVSSHSVLSSYLHGISKQEQNRVMQIPPIFPFGFNLSQKDATIKAMVSQISIIEGPPGTGKTQTILNIIANAVLADQTVAVVSNNNSATSNVLEKLAKYDVDFIAAFLGNSDNKLKFIEDQKNEYPDRKGWILSDEETAKVSVSLVSAQKQLDEMLEVKNRRARFQEERSALNTEFGYFMSYIDDSPEGQVPLRFPDKLNSEAIMNLMVQYEYKYVNGRVRFTDKLLNLLKYGIYNFRFYKNRPETILSCLQHAFYEKRISELDALIGIMSQRLENFDFDQAMKAYSDQSMRLFRSHLAKRYATGKMRHTFTSDDLWKNFGAVIEEYPVILSTTHSLRASVSENYLFDFVVVDEASQVDIVTGALALSCARSIVVVGDRKQLPHVVPDEVAQMSERIYGMYHLDRSYNYKENSLLTSITNLYPDVPRTLLREHYRCHPKIIGFCNQKYYDNELIILTEERAEDKPLVLVKTTKGNHARGRYNQRQIDVVVQEVLPDKALRNGSASIGVISPFRQQVERLQMTIGEKDIEIDTVHKYQGREKDVIILTTVANQVDVHDFADNPNLINVAVSRAAKKLVVITAESSEDWDGTNISDLARYISYHNFEVKESRIYSVFDLLYRCHEDKLKAFRKKKGNVSDYDSEILMDVVVERVLKKPEFRELGRVLHQPLRMLVRNQEELTAEERKFAEDSRTHTDFLIYRKLDKSPILVVEVDGYAFHASNVRQLQRDALKDSILKKSGLDILRLGTNESNETERLTRKLSEILSVSVPVAEV